METERKIHRSPLARLALRTALARTVAISLISAVLIFGVLTVQMALGSDPALGPKAQIAATASSSTASAPAASTAPAPAASEGDDDSPLASVLGSATPAQPVQTQATPAPAPTPVQTSTS